VGSTFTEQMFKRKYSTAEKVENASILHTRFLKDVKRETNPGGESFNSFLIISGGVGWSGTRAGAQAISDQGGSRGNGAFQQIRNSYGKIAGEVTIREFAIKQAESGSAAALRAISTHVDNHLDQWGQTAEWMLTGHRGLYVCAGTISSGVVTITSNAEHISRVRPDMVLVASASNGTSGSLLGGGTLGYVQKVGRSGASPTFTVSTTSGGSAATPAGWTGTMYFFIVDTWYGSNGGGGVDGGTNEGFVIDTLDSWVPDTAPGATLFKNMDRTVDEVLSGVRLSSSEVATLNIAQRLEALAVLGRSRYGWRDDGGMKCYLHTTQFNKLNQLLQRQDVRQAGYSGKLEKASWGYNVLQMTSIGANVEVVDMPFMDPTYAWMTDPKNWLLHSSAGWPSVMDDDGLRFVRKQGLDAYSLQYTGYGSFRTEDPSKTGRVPLS
jgi:hypothetical protein